MRDFLSIVKCARHLVHADDPAARDCEAVALHVFVGFDRIDVLVDLVDFEADAERRQRGGFHEPDVPDGAVVHAAVELFLVETGADLALELQPARAGVDDAARLHAIDAADDVPQRRGEAVEHETRIHARAEERDLAPFGDLVEAFGDFGVAEPGIRQLLAGRHHRDAGGQRLRQFALDAVEPAAGGVQENAVLRLLQCRGSVRSDGDFRRRRIDDVRQLAADAARIEVDRRDDLQIRFGECGAGNESPDGPEPHQHDLRRHRPHPPYAGAPGRSLPAYSPM